MTLTLIPLGPSSCASVRVKPDDAELGRRVGGAVRQRLLAGDRADVDDLAVLGALEVGQRGLAGEEDAGQVDGDRLVPLLELTSANGAVGPGDAGVVDRGCR